MEAGCFDDAFLLVQFKQEHYSTQVFLVCKNDNWYIIVTKFIKIAMNNAKIKFLNDFKYKLKKFDFFRRLNTFKMRLQALKVLNSILINKQLITIKLVL